MSGQPIAGALSSGDRLSGFADIKRGVTQAKQTRRCACFHRAPSKRLGRPSLSIVSQSRLRRIRARNAHTQQQFKSSTDPNKALLGGQWLDKAKAGWKGFFEQANFPARLLSGAATATAAVLLSFPFHTSFPNNIATIIAARPAEISADTWLLSLAISSLLPAAIYVGMTWRVLHKIKHGNTESDQAVAVVAAICVRNAQTIEQLTTLLDGLESHPTIGPAVLKMREATQKQLDLQQLLFRKMEVQEHFVLGQQLQAALQSCSAELETASISIPEAAGLLDFEKSEAIPPNSLLYKIDKYDKILALMVLRQRGMRLTIITILDDLAAKLPPVRNNLELVRRQFSQRFKHEDIMMQQITPPGFNAAEKVRHLLHTQDMVTNLAAHGMKPDEVLGSLLGPWGASSPQTDLERHKMEKMLTGAAADSSEVRSAKQELERLLSLKLASQSGEKLSEAGSSDASLDLRPPRTDGQTSDPHSDQQRPTGPSEGKM